MTLHEKLGLFACAGHLALAILLLLRRTRSSIALPLALLCLDLFAWHFASLAWELTGNAAWRHLDTGLSWLTPPLGLQVILAFVGRTRSLRALLVIDYVFFAQFPFWADTPGWDLVFLAGVIPTVAVAVALLVMHLSRTTERGEQLRSRYILAAIAVGGVFGSSDLWYDHVGLTMSFSSIATFASTSLVAITALRLQVTWREIPSRLALLAIGLGVVGLATSGGGANVWHRESDERGRRDDRSLRAVGRRARGDARARVERERGGGSRRSAASPIRWPTISKTLAALKGALTSQGRRAPGSTLAGHADF
jgi:hypothetical protein